MMDLENTTGASLISNSSSRGIKLLVLIAAVVFQASTCSCSEVGQASKTSEITETIGNDFDSPTDLLLRPTSPFIQDDIIQLKRHLGALAALSGSRQTTGSKSIIPPSKKHLGSIAASQTHPVSVSLGKKLDLLTPSFPKRHLGALMALSGAKPKPLTRSLKESLGEYEDSSATSDSIMGSPDRLENTPDFQEIRSQALDFLPMYANEASFLPLENDLDTDVPQDDDNDLTISLKSKRFLGSLARGGWFPRHFRGIISENSYGKRHIGSLARLGWMPHAKANSRLLDDQRGDGLGLKRNDFATRRRMLYHFTAPSLWTSPRGK